MEAEQGLACDVVQSTGYTGSQTWVWIWLCDSEQSPPHWASVSPSTQRSG